MVRRRAMLPTRRTAGDSLMRSMLGLPAPVVGTPAKDMSEGERSEATTTETGDDPAVPSTLVLSTVAERIRSADSARAG